MTNIFDWRLIFTNIPKLMKYLPITLEIAFLSYFFSTAGYVADRHTGSNGSGFAVTWQFLYQSGERNFPGIYLCGGRDYCRR